MNRRTQQSWLPPLMLLTILICLATAGLPAYAQTDNGPLSGAGERFLGLDDEVAVTMYNNSSPLSRQADLITNINGKALTNEGTHRAKEVEGGIYEGDRVVSSVTLAGKVLVNPKNNINDEVFTISIVERWWRGNPQTTARLVINRFFYEDNKYTNDLILDMPINSDTDNSESRIGAAIGNFTGDIRDDIAIGYETPNGTLDIVVFTKTDMDTALDGREPSLKIQTGITLGQGHGIILEAGNFDGGKYDQIVVLGETEKDAALKIYRADGSGGTTASIQHDWTNGGITMCRSIGLMTGNFGNDANGRDDIMTATINGTDIRVAYYDVGVDFSTTLKSVKTIEQDLSQYACPDIRTAVGDLKDDGTLDAVVSYRTDSYYWAGQRDNGSPQQDIHYAITAFTVNFSKENSLPELQRESMLGTETILNAYYLALDIAIVQETYDEEPQLKIAVLEDEADNNFNGKYKVFVGTAKSRGITFEEYFCSTYGTTVVWPHPWKNPAWRDFVHPGWAFSLVTGEFDGTGLEVSEKPTSFPLEEKYQPVLYLQTPPQHIDVLKDGLTNVSYFVGFNTQFDSEQGASNLTENRSTAEFGHAISAGAEAGMEYKAFSCGIKTKAAVKWNDTIETKNVDYQKTTFSSGLETTVDDLLQYNTKKITYWRYTLPESIGGVLQFAVPEKGTSKLVTASGSNVKYYQPEHENGNLLSYPWFQTVTGDEDGVEVLNSEGMITIGQGNLFTSIALDTEHSTAVGSTKTHTLNASVGVYAGVSAGGANVNTSVDYEYDQAVQKASTAEISTSGREKISFNKAGEEVELLPGWSYGIHPLYFRRDGGPIQVSYTVDMGSLGPKWTSTYDDQPDLALNLPDRWIRSSVAPGVKGEQLVGTYSYLPNEQSSRYRMKGFFVYADAEHEKEIWGSASAKKQIHLRARVYNFSMQEATDVKARFQYQKWNGTEWGTRQTISDVYVGTIPAWGNEQNKINWSWVEAAFTPPREGYYLFWVIVDPKEKIAELPLHDNCDRYSNNAGYWGVPFPVGSPSASEPTLPPDNIAPVFGDFNRSIVVYGQGSDSMEIPVTDSSGAVPRLTLSYENPSDADWITLDTTTNTLNITPGENFMSAANTGTTHVTVYAHNGVACAEETITITVKNFGGDSKITDITHYGTQPARFHLGSGLGTCTLYTQQLTKDGEAGSTDLNEVLDLNSGWLQLSHDNDNWDLRIAPLDGTTFWEDSSPDGTHYATQKAIVKCVVDTAPEDLAHEFHVTVKNNPPKIQFVHTGRSVQPTAVAGLTPFSVLVIASDDTGDPLRDHTACTSCNEWITFHPVSFNEFADSTFIDEDTYRRMLKLNENAVLPARTEEKYHELGDIYRVLLEPQQAPSSAVRGDTAGVYLQPTITITTKDGALEVKENETLKIINTPLSFSETDSPPEGITVSDDNGNLKIERSGSASWTYPVPIRNADKESLTYEITSPESLPNWLSFDATVGEFIIRPASADWQDKSEVEQNVTLQVTDGGYEVISQYDGSTISTQLKEKWVSQTFHFILTNTPPEFTSAASLFADRNTPFTQTISAGDADGDDLTVTMQPGAPDWLHLIAGNYQVRSNTTFFNQDIKALESDIKALESDIEDLKENTTAESPFDANTYDRLIGDLEKQIETLNTNTGTLEKQWKDLNEWVASLKNRLDKEYDDYKNVWVNHTTRVGAIGTDVTNLCNYSTDCLEKIATLAPEFFSDIKLLKGTFDATNLAKVKKLE